MRKNALLFTIISFLSLCAYSQTLSESQKLESLCKVWGFLKYYHPEVARGKMDWDQQLIQHIPLVLSANNKDELSKVYVEWIDSLGKVRECRKCSKTLAEGVIRNDDRTWIGNQEIFSDDLISRLEYIRDNRSQSVNYNFNKRRFSFDDQQPYPEMVFPVMEYRILSLFRFWNVINYYFPYKEDIGEDWNDVLKEMIPRFKNAKDTVGYLFLLSELVARINDSHASMEPYLMRYFEYLVPFRIKIVEDKAVVTGFYNDSLAKADDIRFGDVISAMNGKTVSEIIAERSVYTCASNLPRKLYKIGWYLLFGHSDSLLITYDRDGKSFSKTIHRYKVQGMNMNWNTYWQIAYADTSQKVRTLNNHIGYINMGKLQKNEVRSVMKQMKTMDAIIFDMRHYPNQTAMKIAGSISKERKPCVRLYKPLKGNPGVFREEIQHFGARNAHPYKGKVVVLTNETTISQAEWSCMIIQAVIPTTIIGSQTAGADGNIALFTFPGNIITAFSSIGIYYPDGRKTQRIGIVPDIKVEQTIEGIREHRDEILERAVEFVENSGK